MRIKCKMVYAFFFGILFLFVSVPMIATEVKSAKKLKKDEAKLTGQINGL